MLVVIVGLFNMNCVKHAEKTGLWMGRGVVIHRADDPEYFASTLKSNKILTVVVIAIVVPLCLFIH